VPAHIVAHDGARACGIYQCAGDRGNFDWPDRPEWFIETLASQIAASERRIKLASQHCIRFNSDALLDS
jgi:hypothetical protein